MLCRDGSTAQAAKKEPTEPIRDLTTDREKMPILDRVEQIGRTIFFAVQRDDELERILDGHDPVRAGLASAEQLEDRHAVGVLETSGQVVVAVRREGDRANRLTRCATHFANGLFQE